jgi:hypothetical protein
LNTYSSIITFLGRLSPGIHRITLALPKKDLKQPHWAEIHFYFRAR